MYIPLWYGKIEDKRKQRIELTDYWQEFYEKNDEMSRTLLNE